MTKIKNRTISNEDAEETYVGKTVSFNDGEEDHEGVITQVNTDGTFRIDTGDQEWDLKREEFELSETEDTDEAEEADDSDEAEEEDEDSPDEENEEVEDELLEKEGDTVYTAEMINEMDISALKGVIKDNEIKGVPLSAYRNEDKLKEIIIESLGLEVAEEEEEEKPAKKAVKSGKEPLKKVNNALKKVGLKIVTGKTKTATVPKKAAAPEKVKKIRTERRTVECMKVLLATMKKGFKTRKELIAIGEEASSKSTASNILWQIIKVCTFLNILEEKDGKFKISL